MVDPVALLAFADEQGLHLCSSGLVFSPNGKGKHSEKWEIQLSTTIQADKYCIVSVRWLAEN